MTLKKLELSALPLEQRVIGVRCALSSYNDPPPLERVVDALTQKYGKPQDYRTLGMDLKNTFAGWAEEGKAACGLEAGKGISLAGASQSPNDLGKFYQWLPELEAEARKARLDSGAAPKL